jgi:hypothetical protein
MTQEVAMRVGLWYVLLFVSLCVRGLHAQDNPDFIWGEAGSYTVVRLQDFDDFIVWLQNPFTNSDVSNTR